MLICDDDDVVIVFAEMVVFFAAFHAISLYLLLRLDSPLLLGMLLCVATLQVNASEGTAAFLISCGMSIESLSDTVTPRGRELGLFNC